MTITINLPPEKEALLKRRAARQGQDLDSFLLGLVDREAAQESDLELPKEGQSLAEALEGLIGVLDSGKPGLAENTGEEFTNILVEKHKAGHL